MIRRRRARPDLFPHHDMHHMSGEKKSKMSEDVGKRKVGTWEKKTFDWILGPARVQINFFIERASDRGRKVRRITFSFRNSIKIPLTTPGQNIFYHFTKNLKISFSSSSPVISRGNALARYKRLYILYHRQPLLLRKMLYCM